MLLAAKNVAPMPPMGIEDEADEEDDDEEDDDEDDGSSPPPPWTCIFCRTERASMVGEVRKRLITMRTL